MHQYDNVKPGFGNALAYVREEEEAHRSLLREVSDQYELTFQLHQENQQWRESLKMVVSWNVVF